MSFATASRARALQKWAWVSQVTLLSVVLGGLLALCLQTQHRIASKGLPPRYSALAGRYFELELRAKDAESEMKSLRNNVGKLEGALKASAKSNTARPQMDALSKQLQDARSFAGLLPLEGAGIEVVLSDSKKGPELAKERTTGSDQGAAFQGQLSDYLVHDQDIVGTVNELKNAGAEAIAVNGQRIVATSSIRCVGPVCLINRKPVGGAAPYTITAIGSPRDLEQGLKLTGGYLDTQQLFAYGMVAIRRQEKIVIPAYDGPTLYEFAHPAEAKPGVTRQQQSGG